MIQHVALETRRADGAAAEAFWRLLGFEPVEPPETLRERAAWLQRGATQIHLLWHDDPTAPPEGHVAVVLDDYEATLERLRDAGYEVEPRTAALGSAARVRALARRPPGRGHGGAAALAPRPRPA